MFREKLDRFSLSLSACSQLRMSWEKLNKNTSNIKYQSNITHRYIGSDVRVWKEAELADGSGQKSFQDCQDKLSNWIV